MILDFISVDFEYLLNMACSLFLQYVAKRIVKDAELHCKRSPIMLLLGPFCK